MTDDIGVKSLKNGTKVNWRHPDYQYIERSPVPMDKFQESLPDLPIPSLSDTCQRYLASLQPLLRAEELQEAEKLVEDFLNHDGPALHQSVVQRAMENRHTSYISDAWLDMYLCSRAPLVPYSNVGMLLLHDDRAEMHLDAIQRPVNIVISSLRFYRSLKEKWLRPRVIYSNPSKAPTSEYWKDISNAPANEATDLSWIRKVFPLDMSQFKYMFGATRLPGREKDSLKSYPNSKHMLVIRGGHFYTFDALTSDGELFPPSYYQEALMQIMTDKAKLRPGHKVGILTSERRATWANLREHLCSLSDENHQALEEIDSALLCICLDEHWKYDFEDNDNASDLHQVHLGHNPANRWYDKSFKFIFSRNGAVAFHFEHSWADGATVGRSFMDTIIQDSQKHHFIKEFPSADCSTPNIKVINFVLDEATTQAIERAGADYHARADALSFSTLMIDGFGASDCIQADISPDSFMQSGFHLAYFRLFGHLVSTYESCSTAIYKHGRTETVRTCTAEVEQMVKLFSSAEATVGEKYQALRKCSKKHKQLVRLALKGQGWDRHLLALYSRAMETGSVPELFKHPSYTLATSNVLSTSTGKLLSVIRCGFSPAHESGFGILYRIQNRVYMTVSSNNSKNKSKLAFIEGLHTAYEDMKNVLHSVSKL